VNTVQFRCCFFRNGALFAGFGQDFRVVAVLCRKSFTGWGLQFFEICRE